MTMLESKLNSRSDDFKANAAAMQIIVDDLKEKVAKIALGGGDDARKKHTARGKLLPRDRV
ncbi:MAG TPA: methylcrotonoyl-CoA carboxylase, partial [Oxalobacteraceae bacterium]|nr:methylcrotonoyl-CoA carboxylase [Oxalobacteraceae bacterium]